MDKIEQVDPILLHKPQPKIIRPFSEDVFLDIESHVKEVRRIFDWPGIPLHDKGVDESNLFNRWHWHNLPVLKALHNSAEFIKLVSDLAGRPLKPSYCFLSMYAANGVCPLHVDRPQCQFTVDLSVRSDGPWPIYVDENAYVLKNGEALFYSGTGQKHYRKPMQEDSGTVEHVGDQISGDVETKTKRATYYDLAFFHFVPAEWMGDLS